MLPLNLHVLGLPLAFILSQDQTLHCEDFNLLASIQITCLLLHYIKELFQKLPNSFCLGGANIPLLIS